MENEAISFSFANVSEAFYPMSYIKVKPEDQIISKGCFQQLISKR